MGVARRKKSLDKMKTESHSAEVSQLSEDEEEEEEVKPLNNDIKQDEDQGSGCWHWFTADMRKRHLLWVKIAFFLQSASLVTLYPYLSIHMRALGFSVADAALVNMAIPLADIIGPPVAGLLADKIGNFRWFMATLTFLNGASSLLLLVVPPLTHVPCEGLAASNGTVVSTMSSTLCLSQDSSWAVSFWTYMVIRVILDILRSSSLSLFESALIAIIQEHRGDYGLQKLFGTLGAIVFGPLGGLVIDLTAVDGGTGVGSGSDYNLIFYLYFGLRTLSALAILKLSLEFKKSAKKLFNKALKVLRRVDVLTFLVAFFCTGILWGFFETFLFWHLEDLGSNKLLMGWTLAVGVVFGVPLTVGSKWIMEKIGYSWIMVMALFCYALRLTGYSYIHDAEFSILLESLKPFCTTLVIVAAFTLVKNVTPTESVATINAVFGALYFGVGRGLGGLLGGLGIKRVGVRPTFRGFAVAAAGCGGLYALAVVLQRWKEKKKKKSIENWSKKEEE